MTGDASGLPWTDEQWGTVQRTVQEAAAKARVAASFLPLVGPLADGQASVPKLEMKELSPDLGWYGQGKDRLEIDDGTTLTLITISCNVYLKTQQAEDPDLASARQMLGRAAVLIGRLEDAIVFRGQQGPGRTPAAGAPTPEVYTVQGGDKSTGLLGASPRRNVDIRRNPPSQGSGPTPTYSDELVTGVVSAIDQLEGSGQYGPFACVLGTQLYEAANTPSPGSMILPSDRIVPFLGGPLLRSSSIPAGEGLVIALAGSPIDLVVARDVHVSYLQLSLEPRHVLRVSERFVLRVKQPHAVTHLATV
jgi:uncharacterized linocin/CFP29 family protein